MTEMSDYAAMVPLSSALDRDGLRKLARIACLELYRVSWLRAYLATDGARMLCWYRAPDAEAVRFVLRQQGSQGGTLWPVEIHGPVEPEQAECGDSLTVVELRPRTAREPAAIALARNVIEAALGAAGQRVARVFTARGGDLLAWLVATQATEAVRTCLQAARITPAAVWRCVALDPERDTLFQSSSRTCPEPTRVSTAARLNLDLPDGEDTGAAVDAVIIGAGLSGICALQRLLGSGLEVRLYEAGSDVGGVWHWNRYPGARVDSESYTYGFSFSEEVLAEWRWKELFAAQPEVADYLRFVVDRLDLRRHMRLSTRVACAHYDQARGCWKIATDGGERVTARYLVAGTGALSAVQLPEYPGIDDFGESYHTARWPVAGVDLAGRRVAVVGTGASGVQVIQTIAPQVRHLTVFQRTPTYCIPQRNRLLTAADHRDIARNWQTILASCRASYSGFVHDFDPRPGLTLSAEQREATFEALWNTPGFAFWFGNFGDLMMNAEVNAHASDFVRRKISARVRDPEVARKLMPDHPFGTKRVPLESGYYEVYNRGNVRLVDLRDTPIVAVTPTGIRTSREEHPLDVIIWATGFDAGTGALTRIDIRGEAGQSLADKWRDGPKTYLGLLVSGFPNLFIVNGPHNAAALCNAGRCIEQNVDWIARCIEHLRARGLERIAATPAAEEEWTEHVAEVAETTVLRLNTSSWFFGANTPGKARRIAIYAAGAREYRERCEQSARAGYPGCTTA